MARTRIHDYQSADSTLLLNSKYRGILQAGVYIGFNTSVGGGGGLNLKLSMDADPDNTGSYLGVILTHDGVVIQETAHLDDVTTGYAGDAVNERIDYLVADYTYNASLPNNDVTYKVLQGTAGSPPVPPTLTDDQVLIAEIKMPALAASMSNDYITDVNRKNLYAAEQINLDGLLRNGVYSGYVLKPGSTGQLVTMTAGTILTPEEKRISESADLTDNFTLTDTSGVDFYRYDIVVALHKYENYETNDPDYLVVEGTEREESALERASIPNDAAIDAAALALDSKYQSATSNGYVTKLGYIRVEGRWGVDWVDPEFHHYPRAIENLAFYVSSGKYSSVSGADGYKMSPLIQYWPFTGQEGLLSALDVIQGIVENFYTGEVDEYLGENPIKLYIDGDFHLTPDSFQGIPSYCIVEGLGPAQIRCPPDTNSPFTLLLGSWGCSLISTAGTTFIKVAADGVPQTGVPGGYERVEINVQQVADRAPFGSMLDGIARFRMSGNQLAGDPFVIRQGTDVFEGWFEQHTTTIVANGDWTFRAILTSTGSDGGALASATTQSAFLGKRFNGIKNVRLAQTGTPTSTQGGYLAIVGCWYALIDRVSAPGVYAGFNRHCDIGYLHVYSHPWVIVADASASAPEGMAGQGNSYKHVVIHPTIGSVNVQFGGLHNGLHEIDFKVGILDVNGGSATVDTVYLSGNGASIGKLVVKNTTLDVRSYLKYSDIGQTIINDREASSAVNFDIYGTDSVYGSVVISGATPGDLEWTATSSGNVILRLSSTSVTDSTTVHTNYVGFTALQNADEDRDIHLTSPATFLWTLSTQTLTWDDTLTVQLTRNTSNNTVSASGSAIADGSCLEVSLDRGNASVLTPSVTAQGSGLRNQDKFVLAVRSGDVVYLADGTRLEDGVSTKLGESLPPDGSVTWAKLAASSKAYVNASLEHWFAHDDEYVEDNQFIVDVSSLMAAATYTASTGVVQFGAAADLSSVEAGDTFIDNAGRRFWILAVNDGSDNITLHKGLSSAISVGGGTTYGSIVRGNVAFRNSTLTSMAWLQSAAHEGTITYTSPWHDLTKSVKTGFLWRDGSGNLYPITAVAANTVTIEKVYDTPDTSVATELDGSIETNNNPRSLSLLDAKPAMGYEVISVSDMVMTSSVNNGPEERKDRLAGNVFAPVAPYDDRIRLYAENTLVSTRTYTDDVMREGIHPSTAASRFYSIEITGWMTGVAFISLMDSEISTLADVSFKVDGEVLTGATAHLQDFIGQTAVLDITGVCGHWIGSPSRGKILPPGIHTISIGNDPNAHANTLGLVGIVLLNEPNPQSLEYFELPCKLYADQGVHRIGLDKDITIPSLGDRGGKLIRFVQSSDHSTKGWGHTQLDSLTTTGDTSNASVTITDIGSTIGFSIGDLIRIVYATDPPEKRYITAINPGVSIDVDSNPSITENDATIEYVGSTIAKITTSQVAQLTRSNEQVSMYVPWYAFGTYGIKDANEDYAMTLSTRDKAVCGGDLHHMFMSVGGDGPQDDPSYEIESDETRFSFVGTGLDVYIANYGIAPTIYIDGVNLGAVTLAEDIALDTTGSVSGSFYVFRFPLCWDMDYGQHEVVIDGTDVPIIGFVVYEIKDPDVSGYPTMSTCYLGNAAITDVGAGDLQTDQLVTEVNAVPSGFLRIPGETITGNPAGGVSLFIDPSYKSETLDADSIGGRSTLFSGQAASASTCFIPFYGDAVSVDIQCTGAVALTVTPEFVEHDGSLSAPASFVSATVDGPSGAQSVSAGTAERFTWTLSHESFWVLKLTLTSPAGTVDVNILGAHVRRKFHLNQRRPSITGYSFLQPTPSVRDVRNIKAVKTVLFDGIRKFRQTSKPSTPDGSVYTLGHMRYYSRGEFVTVVAAVQLEDSTGYTDKYVRLISRAAPYGEVVCSMTVDAAAGTKFAVPLSGSLYLSEGHHILEIRLESYSNLSTVESHMAITPVRIEREEVQRATLDLVSTLKRP